MRRISLVLSLVLVGVTAAWVAAPASAFIYWTTGRYNTIGRANLDGTGVNNAFVINLSDPQGLAVHGGFIYWAVPGAGHPGRVPSGSLGSIGRGRVNGTGAHKGSLSEPFAYSCRIDTRTLKPYHCRVIYGFSMGVGVAVDSAHIYWTETHFLAKRQRHYGGDIGRANLDGSGVQDNFIATGKHPSALAVDGTHIYWVNSDTGTIGRATLIGGGVDQHFIRGAKDATGLALGVNRAYIYWSTRAGTIGRANYDGTGVDKHFITGADRPRSVAVDATHIYWVNANGTIGRANLDGTGVDQRFITGAHFAVGLAVDNRGAVGAASASQSSLSGFPPRAVGTTSPPQTVTITNTGDGPLNVTQAQVTGSDPHDFVTPSNTCLGASVAPGASCTIGVSFSPTATGARNATLQLTSNDPAGPLLIPLTGGVPWTLSITSFPQNSTGDPVTVEVSANNLLAGTSDYINVYVNGTFYTRCTASPCQLSLSAVKPTTFDVAADVGPAGTKPFSKAALASARAPVFVSFIPPPPP